jgi:hypothetical protein
MMRLDSSTLLSALYSTIEKLSANIKDPMALKVLRIIRNRDYELLRNHRDLLVYMYINKVLGLLLLEEPSSDKLKSFREKILWQRKNFLAHLEDIVQLLDKCHISYVIYKTLRPVPDIPVDIDILVENNREIHNVLDCLRRRFNVEIWSVDRYSVGIRIAELNEFIDLYTKPHVANLVYMNSKFIIRNTIYLYVNEFDVNIIVPVPRPEVEFCVLLAHSIIKERLITFNDILSLSSYEYLSKKDQIFKLLSESALNISYIISLDALEKHLPTKVSYRDWVKTLVPLTRKSYVLETLPYFITGIYKRAKNLVEYHKRVSYVRGLNR